MKLRIGRVSSPDVQVHSWEPDSHADVYVYLEIEIGVDGGKGFEIFGLMVATPEALRRHAKGPVMSERAMLVVSDFSWREVLKAVAGIVERCTCDDWNESVLKLQRYFRWEYEDYVKDERS